MSLKLRDLRALSDDELEHNYDEASASTVVGISYWHDEIDRRRQERLMQSNAKLARASLAVAAVSAVVSVIATGIAVATLIVAVAQR